MNLEFGSEYDEFTKEVEDFCKEYSEATITTCLLYTSDAADE